MAPLDQFGLELSRSVVVGLDPREQLTCAHKVFLGVLGWASSPPGIVQGAVLEQVGDETCLESWVFDPQRLPDGRVFHFLEDSNNSLHSAQLGGAESGHLCNLRTRAWSRVPPTNTKCGSLAPCLIPDLFSFNEA